MKKYVFISVWCALALAGCKDDSEPSVPEVPADGDYTGLVLNEVCGGEADNKDNDWIELYNTSEQSVDLNGVSLVKTDEDGVSETMLTFGQGEKIDGKSYLVKTRDTDFTQGISNSKNVTITLQAPSGKQIDTFDKAAAFGDEGSHILGGSYSRIPDGTGAWTIVTKATKAATNQVTDPEPPVELLDYTGLVLNELNGNDPKYIELYNGSDKKMDITGVQIRKDDEQTVYIAPENTEIEAKGFLMLLADQADYSTGFTSGLSAKKSLKIELLAPDGTTSLDVFKNLTADGEEKWGEKNAKYNGEEDESGKSWAFGRKDNGSEWYKIAATQGESNAGAELAEEIVW